MRVAENSTHNYHQSSMEVFFILEHTTRDRGKLKVATTVQLACNCVATGGHK